MQTTQSPKAGERTLFTAGPWRAQESARGWQVNANGHEPGNSTLVAVIHETAVFASEPDHAKADARLIATAPRMAQFISNLYNAEGITRALNAGLIREMQDLLTEAGLTK